MDPLGMILITIPVFIPMLNALGMDLVWFGVIVVKYIGISLLSPPVGFNIYVVASAANNEIPLKTIYRGCWIEAEARGSALSWLRAGQSSSPVA
jgi:TRAP-type C4-dicarboxylate transport system permease large subunit